MLEWLRNKSWAVRDARLAQAPSTTCAKESGKIRKSERLQSKLADVIKCVPPGWPYQDSVFFSSTKPVQALQLYRDLEWLVVNRYLTYGWIPEKGYFGVVVLKPFEGRVGIMTGRPIFNAEAEEAGVYSLCAGGNLTIEGGVGEQTRPYDGNLFNHACHGQTVVPKRILLDDVPVVVFDTVGTLVEGQECVWDYNGSLKENGYVLSCKELRECLLQRKQVQACRCSWPSPCPKKRGLWI